MKALLALPLLLFVVPAAPAETSERPSGRMVLDEVWDGLRRYRAEKEPRKRVAYLEKLAPTRDPRVAVAMGEFLFWANAPEDLVSVGVLMARYFLPQPVGGARIKQFEAAVDWWRANEADLRRRAEQLP
jgi:hypothetical protein